jgi:hypothetical protein
MPINATQKIPSPVSININSHLSDAQIEYIKRQLYYMLSQDVGEVISHDKLYDIVTSFVSNNLEMLKTKLAMSYKGETSVLPDNAKVGDAYTIAETIYEEGMYYIPMDMGSIGELDGIIRYYFDSVFGSDVIDVVTQMVEDGKINNFALFDGDVRFDIPLVGAGYDNGFYIDSTKETYDYGSHHFKYILVPSEYGEDFFFGRNAVKFHKGELVVFTDKGWVSADAEMLKNIRYDLDDFKTEVGERFNSNDESYATIDLENVSNEDFKRKAEEAGVGGDNAELLGDAPMVFKGIVDTLPNTANEGDVYKVDATRKNLGSFSGAQYNARASAYGFAFYAESGLPTPFEHIIENFVEGTTYIFDMPESRYTYANCSHIEDGVEMWLYGELQEAVNDEFEYLTDEVTVYEYDPNATSSLYVYHNGEWVEL